MPADNGVVAPRNGHIDIVDGLVNAPVALSVEYREGLNGEQVTLLHLDVGVGEEVETPFSVGIPLRQFDVDRVIASLLGVRARESYMPAHGDRLN